MSSHWGNVPIPLVLRMSKSLGAKSPGKPLGWNQPADPGCSGPSFTGPLLCVEYYPRPWGYSREQDSHGYCPHGSDLFIEESRKWIQSITNCDEPKDLWIGLFMIVRFLWGYSTKITSKQKKIAVWIPAAGIMLYGLDSLPDSRMKLIIRYHRKSINFKLLWKY